MARVRFYANDQIIEDIPLSIARPDVHNAFPEFARSLHGWHAAIAFGDQVGYAHISAEALDGRGTSLDSVSSR